MGLSFSGGRYGLGFFFSGVGQTRYTFRPRLTLLSPAAPPPQLEAYLERSLLHSSSSISLLLYPQPQITNVFVIWGWGSNVRGGQPTQIGRPMWQAHLLLDL